jgi:hypothetical protein
LDSPPAGVWDHVLAGIANGAQSLRRANGANGTRVGEHISVPTTLIPTFGYRVVFAHTEQQRNSDVCSVEAQFFNAKGEVIGRGEFAFGFGESANFNLELLDDNGARTLTVEGNGKILVWAILRHEPLGCATAISEVARVGRDAFGNPVLTETWWVVPVDRSVRVS